MADTACHSGLAANSALGSAGVASRTWGGELATLLAVAISCGVGRLTLGPSLGLVFFILSATAVCRLAGSGVHDQRSIGWRSWLTDIVASVLGGLFAVGVGDFWQLVGLIALAGTLVLAFGSFCRLLTAAGLQTPLSRTAIVALLLLWLTLPVWLSPYWTSGPTLDRVLDAHPLLAANGLFLHLGDWTHAPIAYNWLTDLNQDIPYAPPASIALSVVSHGFLALAATVAAAFLARKQPTRIQ